MYAAMTPAGAIAEVVLHDVPMPSAGHVHDWERDKASDLHLGEIAIPRLKLIDLTSTGLRRIGLYVHDLFGTESVDYPRTRDWGLYIWQNHKDAQGLYWMSVREKGCPVVMLFGDRLGSLEHIPSNLLE
ncbi:MAG: RES family NAD+ phosphorylase [Noviherbaspirillum sp.]